MPRRNAARCLCSAVLAAVLPGCALFESSPEPVDPAPVELSDSGELGQPFNLEVLSDVNDGEELNVLARLSPKTSWPADDLVVRLKGMRGGEVLDYSNFIPARKLTFAGGDTRKMLTADQPIEFSLKVKSAEITDYQLDLLWGEEARAYLALLRETSPSGGEAPEIRIVSVEPEAPGCSGAACPQGIAVRAELFNRSARILDRVTLGIGYRAVGGETPVGIEEPLLGERRLEVRNLELASSSARPIRVVIEPDPSVPLGPDYLPAIRLLSFELR